MDDEEEKGKCVTNIEDESRQGPGRVHLRLPMKSSRGGNRRNWISEFQRLRNLERWSEEETMAHFA